MEFPFVCAIQLQLHRKNVTDLLFISLERCRSTKYRIEREQKRTFTQMSCLRSIIGINNWLDSNLFNFFLIQIVHYAITVIDDYICMCITLEYLPLTAARCAHYKSWLHTLWNAVHKQVNQQSFEFVIASSKRAWLGQFHEFDLNCRNSKLRFKACVKRRLE